MDPKITTEKESVVTVSNSKGELVGIVRRDPTTKKHLIYKCEEMVTDDIVGLISPGFMLPTEI